MAKNNGIVRPILTARCKRCGRLYARQHPKDTQQYCERCRYGNKYNTVGATNNCGTGNSNKGW
jgi:uncharacterized OB-fold protein